jgi:hypothetical protein
VDSPPAYRSLSLGETSLPLAANEATSWQVLT